MRVLLDENIPIELATLLTGHHADTVVGIGWAGTINGELLRGAGREKYDAFLTMDASLEYQQSVAKLPFGVLVLRAASKRMDDLRPLIPAALSGLNRIRPGVLIHVGA